MRLHKGQVTILVFFAGPTGPPDQRASRATGPGRPSDQPGHRASRAAGPPGQPGQPGRGENEHGLQCHHHKSYVLSLGQKPPPDVPPLRLSGLYSHASICSGKDNHRMVGVRLQCASAPRSSRAVVDAALTEQWAELQRCIHEPCSDQRNSFLCSTNCTLFRQQTCWWRCLQSQRLCFQLKVAAALRRTPANAAAFTCMTHVAECLPTLARNGSVACPQVCVCGYM